jgi:type III pantothenate kinase
MSGVNAVVDIGNTAIKVAAVTSGELQGDVLYYSLGSSASLLSQGALFSATTLVIGCSGRASMATDLAAQIFARGGEAIIIGRDASLPFKSDYAPGQAGVDRLANVAAAIEATAGGPAIVIDAGSAVTVEMISTGRRFAGGVIMPGFRLQSQALNEGTAALPMVEPSREGLPGGSATAIGLDLPATSTETAIKAGVHLACLGGIEKAVREYLRHDAMEQAPIIVTGGDGAFIARQLDLSGCITCPRPAEYDAALTLKGLLLLAQAQQ